VFFIANQNHLGAARPFRFRVTADGEPECWDAMRNEITSVPCTRQGKQVELSLTLEPNESVLLVFQPAKRPLPLRLESGAGTARSAMTVTRDPTPASAAPVLEPLPGMERSFEGCSWIWYPEGNPAQSAPAATRYFRKQITLPADRKIKKATLAVTADNSAMMFVNGQEAGQSDASANGWRNPAELDVTARLRSGVNQLAIAAANAKADNVVNPAGLIGRLTVEFESGTPLTVRIDKSWKASQEKRDGWTDAGFDDSSWPNAKELARFGSGPWGRFGGGMLTLSPATADPFFGHCDLPATLDLTRSRIYLELDELAPETAARITVNDADAGGFLAKPLRLDITRLLKPNANTIRIEPFAPKSARLVIYE
jgi:hypothetical protein